MSTTVEQNEDTDGADPEDAAEAADSIEPVLAQLDEELIALEPVKTRIREIAALLVIDRLRRGSRPHDRRCT